MFFGEAEYVTKLLTPPAAGKLLSICKWSRQRVIDPRHVNFLGKVRELGEFNPYTPIEIARIEGKARAITNGHHRLTMIANGTEPMPVTFCYIDVKTEADIAALYASHDSGVKVRTVGEILQGFGTADALGLTNTEVTSLQAAAKLLHSGFAPHACGLDYEAKSKVYANQLVLAYAPAGKQFFADIAGVTGRRRKLFVKKDVMAIALATYSFAGASKKAAEFWQGAAKDDGLSAGDPRHTLLLVLRGEITAAAERQQSAWFPHAVAACWNAWFEGRKIKRARVDDIGAEMKLLGTVFDGSRRFKGKRDDTAVHIHFE